MDPRASTHHASPLTASILVTAVAALVAVLAMGTPVRAADEGIVASHPLVGAWVVTDAADPEGVPPKVVVNSDGTATFFGQDGPLVGAWQPTDDQSAIVTLVTHAPDAVVTLRVAATASEDGSTFTATHTFEVACPCGESPGELGPGSSIGERIVAEPMGTPVGSLPPPGPAPSEPAAAE